MNSIKTLFGHGRSFIETIILFMLSYIIPKKNDLVIFGSRRGEYIIGNPKVYYLYLADKEYNLNLLFFDRNNINTDKRIKTYGNGYIKYWYILRAKYIIIDNFSFDVGHSGVFVGNFNLIQTWHGEAIKGIGFLSELYLKQRNKIVLFFEKLEYKTYKAILSNVNTKEIMQGVFNNSKNVKNIGLPRNDLLLDDYLQEMCKNVIVEKEIALLKNNFSNLYLFTPTFREQIESQYFNIEQLEILNKALQQKKILLMIKAHPRETRDFLNGNKYSNIVNITSKLPYDAIDFLAYIDGIMTDYSSIYIDFLLTGKPIVWYQNDLDDYINKERGLIYPASEVVIKESTAYEFNKLVSIIENINTISRKESYKKNYTKLKEKFYGNKAGKTHSCKELTKLLFPNKIIGKK